MAKAKQFDSVWDALESDPAKAASMRLRSELMMALTGRLEKHGGTQAEKAKFLGITQPRLNDLIRGKIDKFSLDALITLIHAAGMKVSVKIGKAA
ncbi:MAG: XRE family transcriptional regulator [Proteobacteria bacterium]|nr:XRE family transcriptional regulator [Pseudomonadota bacterium]